MRWILCVHVRHTGVGSRVWVLCSYWYVSRSIHSSQMRLQRKKDEDEQKRKLIGEVLPLPSHVAAKLCFFLFATVNLNRR